MTGDMAVEELREYDHKLKLLLNYVKRKIEVHEHNSHPNPNLYNEINGILYFIETIKLKGYFNKDIKDELGYYSGRNQIQDSKKILEYLKTYAKRIENNTFTNFFEDKPNPGLYRIDFVNGDGYMDIHESELEALISAKNLYADMELDDPNKDIIKINLCPYYHFDSKTKQKHRCSHYLIKGPCALALSAEKNECPNLENLVRKKIDFFEQLMVGNYTTIDIPLKA